MLDLLEVQVLERRQLELAHQLHALDVGGVILFELGPSNHRVDHDVLERVCRVGMELVLEADDLVAELGLALLARDELERLQQVLAGAQRHAAAGRVDDRS